MSWASARPHGFQSDQLALASWSQVRTPLDTHAVGGWAGYSTLKKTRIIPLFKDYNLETHVSSAVLTETGGNPVVKFYGSNDGTGSDWAEVTVQMNSPAQACPYHVTNASGRFVQQRQLFEVLIQTKWQNAQG